MTSEKTIIDQTAVFSNDPAAQALRALEVALHFEVEGTVEYTANAFPRFNHGLPHPLLLEERAEAVQAAKDLKAQFAEDLQDLQEIIAGFEKHTPSVGWRSLTASWPLA